MTEHTTIRKRSPSGRQNCSFREGPHLKLSVKFHDPEIQWISAKAADEGVSLGEIIRRAIRMQMNEAAHANS